MSTNNGAVAAGHTATVWAAETILRQGGNAFDGAVAAHFAACVAEPVLCSLGGGGFLLARPVAGHPRLYDFFVQTPKIKRPPSEMDFYPISADFGSARQEFHIGLGSVATPGTVSGLFAVHRDLCTRPMTELLAPAVQLARRGVVVNAFQAYILKIVRVICEATTESRSHFRSPDGPGLIEEGELHRQPDLADTLELLGREGERSFYEGEIAAAIEQLCRTGGGHLTRADLSTYRTVKRKPLRLNYRDSLLFTNPPPSCGGVLIAFALKLLERHPLGALGFGSFEHLCLLAAVLDATYQARIEAQFGDAEHSSKAEVLDSALLDLYDRHVRGRMTCTRGTTQISVIDGVGNMASLTTSNGEGCGVLVPDTGVMLNNMLGEADLNLRGFHRWKEDLRMTSMMSPTFVFMPNGQTVSLGSGGSNRIRTAILQVLNNLIDFRLPLKRAVESPRIHLEAGHLSIEAGFESPALDRLKSVYEDHLQWQEKNLFFGGVHAVVTDGGRFEACGDPRRGGVARDVI